MRKASESSDAFFACGASPFKPPRLEGGVRSCEPRSKRLLSGHTTRAFALLPYFRARVRGELPHWFLGRGAALMRAAPSSHRILWPGGLW